MNILRKVCVLVLSLMMGVSVYAQKASVETASISLRTYNKDGEKDEIRIHNLKEAKKHIDMAANNPSTSNDPKMFQLRARVYFAMSKDKLGPDGTSCLPDDNAIATAAEAIIKCHKTDDKQKYSRVRDAYDAFVGIAVSAQNIAIFAYNDKNYDRAIQYYQIVRDLIPYDNESLLKRQNLTDDGLLNSIAYTELQAKKYEDAKRDYSELIKRSYNDPLIYLDLYSIYMNIDQDTNKAIETIDKGRRMFEENRDLKYEQIYVYSKAGRSEELLKVLAGNIELDPYNSVNYQLRGKLYRNEALKYEAEAETTEGDKKKELLAKSKDYTDKSLEDCKKAIEMNEQNMDAHYELGEMYYIKGADVLDEANKLNFNETEKYDALNAEAKEYFMLAIPSWEAIYNYSTDDSMRGKAAQFLMQLYVKTEQTEKYKQIKAENQ